MAQPRTLVLRAPGVNCDEETKYAFELAGAKAERIHIQRIIEQPSILAGFQIFCLPGGFSFGDDIAAGRILAVNLRTRLGDTLAQFRDRGGLILGICNGFQALLQTGLLLGPDPKTGAIPATLALNEIGRFQDRWVHLKVQPGRCVFFQREQILTLPVAHGEGNFVVSDADTLTQLQAQGRIVVRYVDADGREGGYPINPNGSMGNVAGICDETGRVFAMMPHPERHVSPLQHPRWTRRVHQPAEGDGLELFRGAVNHVLRA